MSVQIDQELFISLWRFLELSHSDDPEAIRLRNALWDKLERMAVRYLYEKSKTAETQEEREAARLKYLELHGR